MIKIRYMLSVLSFICLTSIPAIAGSAPNPLDELSPLIEALTVPNTAPQTAQNLQNFLEKATDIALATIEKSNTKISKEKLQEFKDDLRNMLWDELADFYTPIDTD